MGELPPWAVQSTGRQNGEQNKHFKCKQNIFRSQKYFELLIQKNGNSVNGCDFF
jgi:hypothetical protein